MKKEKKLLKSPHIIIAIVTGICIIVMAVFSKKILNEPFSFVEVAIPPFIAFVFSLAYNKIEDREIGKVKYWIIGIISSTAVIIILHA